MSIIDKVCGKIGLMDPEDPLDSKESLDKEKAKEEELSRSSLRAMW